ncbi:MAG: KTSC domain-containing protein [Patescibacteria group bacterium]|nr:KTSC domain-containing protein [Patescibacteria group bacterium]
MAIPLGFNPSPMWKPIDSFAPMSSFISLLEYDQNNLTLTTHMLSGAIYQHKFFVPLEWDALKTSQDHGSYWSRAVRGKKLAVRLKASKSPRANLKHKTKTRGGKNVRHR